MIEISKDKEYNKLLNKIGSNFLEAKNRVYKAIDNELTQSNWKTGQYIVEYEQEGNIRAEYGKQLLLQLAKDLSRLYGKGFSRSNLVYMRLFYIKYPKGGTASHLLSWSHYYELLKLKDNHEREFYKKQSIIENWSVRELKRQKKTGLFQRLALSKNKNEILELAKKGYKPTNEKDIIKEPYIFEFLGIPEGNLYSESELETKLIKNLQSFLLELGKGFAFVGKQYKITLANKHNYVDLVFYNYILKCFVLIDLKVNEVEHKDVGQMITYLNYFNAEIIDKSDNETIGIILASEKDDVFVEYATATVSNKLAVGEYQLYLPDKKVLRERVKQILEKT
ncbi:MAG: PDDEXK nuclease domain-containing protein [Candidatus Delongbacteria bacterium]|jgi:predicted nuclease of restriction endonuclease-like (RecB) superfamily|nr:PDDEXK nuclease domain-containing protein [Candidatus Delongbacteria bacterium]